MNLAERTIGLSGDIFVKRTLELLYSWAKFIRPSRSGFSESELVGLLAELYILKNYMLPALGPDLSVKSWIGPEGAKQDFVVEKFSSTKLIIFLFVAIIISSHNFIMR